MLLAVNVIGVGTLIGFDYMPIDKHAMQYEWPSSSVFSQQHAFPFAYVIIQPILQANMEFPKERGRGDVTKD